MDKHLYHYCAYVESVYDGDTCTVKIDLGLHTWLAGEKIRLARIDAPELRGSERERGLQSRDYLRGLIDGQKILLQTVKDRRGKYGRYLGEIWLEEGGQWINVNDRLVEKGYAVFKAY